MDQNKNKKCIYCQRELPDNAIFCPFCEKEQVPLASVPIPRARKWRLILPPLALLAVIALAVLFAVHRPRTYEGGAKVLYRSGGKTWQIMATFGLGSALSGSGQETWSLKLPEYERSGLPAQLYVTEGDGLPQDEDALASGAQAFSALVDTITLETIPAESFQQMDADAPGSNPSFPYVLCMASVYFSPANGTNDLVWTLHLRNGDTIILRQQITCELQKSITVSYLDEPMEDMAQFRETLTRLSAQEEGDTLIEVELAPVTYEGDLSISARSFSFVGTDDGEQRTAWTGSLDVSTRAPQICALYNIDFIGSDGIGLHATESVTLENCAFTGYDTAVFADDGSWVAFSGCEFIENTVGFLFDSQKATSSSEEYYDNTFQRNETGIRIKRIPGTANIRFINTVMEDNGTDCDSALGTRVTFE